MTRRPIELLALVSLGAAWGLFDDSPVLTFAGAAVGAAAWSAWDALRAARLLTWLNNFDLRASPRLSGVWIEIYDRSKKIFKKLEKQRLSSDAKLSNFLAAIQASPNGVVLLDESGRIEWVNLTAANQLGVDPLRDIGQYVQNLVRAPDFSAYLAHADFSAEIQINGVRASATHPSRISVQIHPYGSRRKLMLTRDVTTRVDNDSHTGSHRALAAKGPERCLCVSGRARTEPPDEGFPLYEWPCCELHTDILSL